jgi:hypothetical protein
MALIRRTGKVGYRSGDGQVRGNFKFSIVSLELCAGIKQTNTQYSNILHYMKKVPATLFIRNIGLYLHDAADAPIAITTHGRERAVLLSAQAYRALASPPQPAGPPATPARPLPRRDNDPMTTALSVVSTSIRPAADKKRLLRALAGDAKERPLLRIFFAEVSASTIAALVNTGQTSWRKLYRALATIKGIDDEKASYIRDMAKLELAAPPRRRASPA